jgi:hypothetical protein
MLFVTKKQHQTLQINYNNLLKKHQELELHVMGASRDESSLTYKDAIQDAQVLLTNYSDNPAMLAVVAPFIEFLKQSFKERQAKEKTLASVKKKRTGQTLKMVAYNKSDYEAGRIVCIKYQKSLKIK